MKDLDSMLTEFVTPVLRGAGFRKAHRTYRLAAPNGSQALVNVENYPLSMSQTTFLVNVEVTVEAYRAWIHHRITPSVRYRSQPSIGDGFWRDRLWPPPDVEYRVDEFRSQLWGFDGAEGAARCGRRLARMLAEETVPFLTRLLDRPAQGARRHDPAEDEHVQLGANSFGEILLLVDDGPSGELDTAMADAEQHGDHDLVSWARERLASTSASPRQQA